MIKMTAEESKFLQTGEGNPYPDEKVELTPEEPAEAPPETPDETTKEEAKAEEPEKPEEEGDGEEEVIEVADGTNPDGKPRRKVINYGAYDKMRHKANKHAEELGKLREQVAYLSGLSQTQQNAKPAPQQQQAPQEIPLTPPDKKLEPEKYLAWLETAAAKALQFEHQNRQQSEQSTQFQQLNQAVMQHEQAFVNGDGESEPHPDFYDAVKFLQDRHRAELQEAGYQPHEIQQIMAARAQSVAVKALQAGKSPAERVYSLAKLNGYKKAAPVVKETEAEKITRQAEKQAKANKTIADLPGGESKGLTAETLANMDPKEFLKAWSSGEAKKVMNWTE